MKIFPNFVRFADTQPHWAEIKYFVNKFLL